MCGAGALERVTPGENFYKIQSSDGKNSIDFRFFGTGLVSKVTQNPDGTFEVYSGSGNKPINMPRASSRCTDPSARKITGGGWLPRA